MVETISKGALLKRINAYMSLVSLALLFIHSGYETAAYILYYYNPVLSKLTGWGMAASVLIHAVISVVSLFAVHDSKSIMYIRLNMETFLQRICAALILCLLPVHILTFAILKNTAGNVIAAVLTEGAAVIFYAAVYMHAAISFGKSLITLGRIEKEKTMKKVNIISTTACLILFAITITVILSTHIKMFYVN